MKPCCDKFERRARAYIDLTLGDDDSLRLLPNLLWKMDYSEAIDIKDAHSIAHTIEQYLDRKQMTEYVFLNRTLPDHILEEADFRSEAKRIRLNLQG